MPNSTGNKTKELFNRIERDIPDMFQQNLFENILKIVSNFIDYSFNNTLLIAMQKPDASFINGYQTWKKNYNRIVKHGEHGIKILAPSPYRTKVEVEKINPVTQNPLYDENGKPITELVEIEKSGFRAITVFDVSQTEGEPISLEKNRYQENLQLQALKDYFKLPDLDNLQNLQNTLLKNLYSFIKTEDAGNIKHSLMNQSIIYAVCQHYNGNPSYDFSKQLSDWSIGKKSDELKDFLNIIYTRSRLEIKNIDKKLEELSQQIEFQPIESEVSQKPSNVVRLNNFKVKDKLIPETAQQQTYIYSIQDTAYGVVKPTEKGYDCITYRKSLEVIKQETVENTLLSPKQALESIFDSNYKMELINTKEFNDKLKIAQETGWPPILHPYLQNGKLPEMDISKEPIVTVIWSEDGELRDNLRMPLSIADKVFYELDNKMKNQEGYNKTKFELSFTLYGEQSTYEGRQDFGDGDGSLIDHIKSIHKNLLNNEDLKAFKLNKMGQTELDLFVEECNSTLNELIPYLNFHCKLSEIEQLAAENYDQYSKMDLPDEIKMPELEYYSALIYYVSECRNELNTAIDHYNFPEIPQKQEYMSPEINSYKQKVMKEIEEEARNAAMTVDEYIANGYEPKPVVEMSSACNSNYKGMVAFVGMDNKVYLGKKENYDSMGHYDNRDSSLCFISENKDMYYYLYGNGFIASQELMLYHGQTLENYQEFSQLKNDFLSHLEQVGEILFNGKPFFHPDLLDTNKIKALEGTQAATDPFYCINNKEPEGKQKQSVIKRLEINKKNAKLQKIKNHQTSTQKNNPQRD